MLIVLLAFAQDEEDLLNKLFHEQHEKMYNIAFRIVHTKESAEEAVQESFLRIMKHIGKIKNLPSPEQVPYCVVIVKNVSTDMIRSRKRTVPVEELEFMIADDDSNPEQEFFKLEDVSTLYQLLNQLQEDDRKLLLLKYGRKMGWQQIADMQEISLEAAMKRGQRAIKRMRAIAKQEGYSK